MTFRTSSPHADRLPRESQSGSSRWLGYRRRTRVDVRCGAATAGLLLAILIAVQPASAQSTQQPPTTSPASQPSVASATREYSQADLETLLKQTETDEALDDTTRPQVQQILQSAITERMEIDKQTAKLQRLQNETQTLSQKLEQIRTDLKRLQDAQPEQPDPNLTLTELQQAGTQITTKLTDLKKSKTDYETANSSRDQLLEQIARQRTDITAARQTTTEQLAALAKTETPSPLNTARQIEAQLRLQRLAAEAAALEAEANLYDADDKSGLLRQQLALVNRQIELKEAELTKLNQLIQEKEAEQAAERVLEARLQLIAADRTLKPYAEANELLTVESQELIDPIKETNDELIAAERELAQIIAQLEQTKSQYARSGETDSLGALLRKQRAQLPNTTALKEDQALKNELLDQIQFQFFEYDSESRKYESQAYRDSIVRSLVPGMDDLPDEASQAVEPLDNETQRLLSLQQAARELVDSRRQYLGQLVDQYDGYINSLARLDRIHQETIQQVEAYRRFIDERVLWIRSSPALYSSFTDVDEDTWLFHSVLWRDLALSLWTDMRRYPSVWLFVGLVIAVLRALKRRCIRELNEIGVQAQKGSYLLFRPTLRSLLLTVVLSTPWILLGYFLSWRIDVTAIRQSEFRAIGSSLTIVINSLLTLELLRNCSRSHGLLLAHFGYAELAVRQMRRHLWLIYVVAVPVQFLENCLRFANPDFGRDGIERLLFIVQAIAWTLFLRRLANRQTGLLSHQVTPGSGGWLTKLRSLFRLLLVLSPPVFAVLTFAGYYYTARELALQWQKTILLLVVIILIRDLLLRAIVLQRRRLAIEQARERRAALQESLARGEDVKTGQPEPAQFDLQADLSTQSDQTQQLVTIGAIAAFVVGSWMIWIDVLPALRILDSWTIWSTHVEVSVSQDGADPETRLVSYDVTVGSLLKAMLIAAITFVASRNVPGLMEISLLQRLPLDPPVRYAITRLTSYAIVVLGVILGFNAIYIGWSQVQYVAAALTFALGFGLQEIFANFVAGIILLFEQPIRVGDIVTVAGTTGTVSRIRIRATTITDWDRKEFVIPNREFITGNVLNWTLTDTVNRIVIEVGVAYGSDTEQARELLFEVCREHPSVLDDPQTSVVFDGFGDSTLNFTVRTYLPNFDNRLDVIHELHTAIDQKFRQHHIEIAFPQRDLHIRSIPTALIDGTGNSGGIIPATPDATPPASPPSQNSD